MSDRGCCFCLPSWVATIPGWIIAVALLIGSFSNQSDMVTEWVFFLGTVLNIVPYGLSVYLKKNIWPRVYIMVTYIAATFYIGFLCYFIPEIANSEYCYHYPEADKCNGISKTSVILCASWAFLNIFIFKGLYLYVKQAHDAKHAETHPYERV